MEFLLFIGVIILFLLLIGARSRLETLEKDVALLQKQVDWFHRNGSWAAQAQPPEENVDLAGEHSQAAVPGARWKAEIAPEPPATASVAEISPAAIPRDESRQTAFIPATTATQPAYKAFELKTPEWLTHARAWLFDGNLVAKLGLLILFIGVGFLLKYTAARVTLPIELRLTGVVLADLALLFWGWRIRQSRPTIGLAVQGSALGILMLVTFGAFRLYDLIPAGLAFALLFALTFFTCLLAVLQDARWLAVFGIIGGFAAPILTSTEHGSHVGLFSYYALLNAGILAIALKRSWRMLNLLGFAFTFAIATTWGVLRYQAEHYATTQPFLILFFVFYVAIAVLYALRQAPDLRHYVDGTLVFGTPLLSFGLQYGLVSEMPFGPAFSALMLGMFYTGLTLALWRHRGGTLRLLVEAFLALGVVFGTLAIPLALDGRWTSAAWALESAGIVWVGLRQRDPRAWGFGVLVQGGAWISFLAAIGDFGRAAAHAHLWLGFFLLAAASFAVALSFRSAAQDDNEFKDGGRDTVRRPYPFATLASVFLGCAALWLLAGGWSEIVLSKNTFVRHHAHTLYALSAVVVAALLGWIARRLAWRAALVFAIGPQLLATVVVLWLSGFGLASAFGRETFSGTFAESGFIPGLLLALAAGASALAFHRQGGEQRRLALALLIAGGYWWFVHALGGINAWGMAMLAHLGVEADPWPLRSFPLYGMLLAVSAPLFVRLAERLRWDTLRRLADAAWIWLLLSTLSILLRLLNDAMPLLPWPVWLAYVALWLACEWLLRTGRHAGEHHPQAYGVVLRVLHTLRLVGPWIILGPLGFRLLRLALNSDPGATAAADSWARYLTAWAMAACVAALIPRTRAERWPTPPLADWYRRVLIPAGTGVILGLTVFWNLTQDGHMAPLPYLPILNPLDLTSGFASLLAIAAWRLRSELPAPALVQQLPYVAAGGAYLWFNLMLLRTAAHYLDIPYQPAPLFQSQFVQAMLSLTWCASALVLMRFAAQRYWRLLWMAGAALLALVVVKLFLVDLASIGGVERIVSFLGVGLLMLAIGYLAPFPTEKTVES